MTNINVKGKANNVTSSCASHEGVWGSSRTVPPITNFYIRWTMANSASRQIYTRIELQNPFNMKLD